MCGGWCASIAEELWPAEPHVNDIITRDSRVLLCVRGMEPRQLTSARLTYVRHYIVAPRRAGRGVPVRVCVWCGGHGVVRVRVLERVRRMLRIAVQQWRIRIFMGHIIIRTH